MCICRHGDCATCDETGNVPWFLILCSWCKYCVYEEWRNYPGSLCEAAARLPSYKWENMAHSEVSVWNGECRQTLDSGGRIMDANVPRAGRSIWGFPTVRQTRGIIYIVTCCKSHGRFISRWEGGIYYDFYEENISGIRQW